MPRRYIPPISPKTYLEFKMVLQDFAINYLIDQPDNIPDYGIKYFNSLKYRHMAIKLDEYSTPDVEEPNPDASPPPNVMRRKSVFTEPFDPEDDKEEHAEPPVFEKSNEQKNRLKGNCKKVLLFKNLDEDQFTEIVNAMFEKNVVDGEVVIRQGDDGDYFYIIENGLFEATVLNANGTETTIKTYTNTGSFGELALLYNVPRSATVTAKSDGRIWALNRETFKKIVVKSAFKKRKLYELLIEQVPMLSVLEPYERQNVADAMTPKFYKDGECIIRQGTPAEGMFFVESGNVKVTVFDDTGNDVLIKEIGQGGYFGELALVTHQPRAASVFAEGPVKLAYLDVEAFERLLGPCMDIMRRNMELYEAQLKVILDDVEGRKRSKVLSGDWSDEH